MSCEIQIDIHAGYIDAIAALLHEKAHADHFNSGCMCMAKRDHIQAEYHAMRDSTRAIIELNIKAVTLNQIYYLLHQRLETEGCHSQAVKQLMKTKLWLRLIDAL